MMIKQGTLKEISRQTGVAFSTCAAILRADTSCFAGLKVKQRVLATARELNYRPNPIARSLRTRKSNTIGLILPHMIFSSRAIDMELIENLAWQKGYHLFIGYSQNDVSKEEALLSDFVDRYVDGIIIILGHPSFKGPYLKSLISTTFPLVAVNYFKKRSLPTVSTDFYRGGQMAARYLLKLNHKRVNVIAADTNYPSIEQRLRGFREVFQEAGLKSEGIFILEKSTNKVVPLEKLVIAGYQTARKVLSQPKKPTAIFAGNDEIGLGVIKAALDLGIKVPEGLSVIGFDDSPAATFSPISLTTIRQPREEISKKAVEMLLTLIEQKSMRGKETKSELKTIWLKPKLIIRSSTGPAKS
ncbi:MAG: LacI family DNA-binding transcriptional regulator [Candidatus Omnitrophota bacterium]